MNPSRFLSMIEDAPARAHAWNDMPEYARREAVQHNPEFLKYVHLSWERLPPVIKSGLSHLGESVSSVETAIDAVTQAMTDRGISMQEVREHQDLVRAAIESVGQDADAIGEEVLSALEH